MVLNSYLGRSCMEIVERLWIPQARCFEKIFKDYVSRVK